MRWFGSLLKRASTRAEQAAHESEPPARLLDGAMLAALRGMSLRGGRAGGAIAGVHRGGMPGAGEDFFQHRAYVRGEDIRGVDFRASARVGQLLVKERHRPLRRGLKILLDTSASMEFPRMSAPKESKALIARRVGAALSYLALRDGDPVILFALSGGLFEQIGRRVPDGRAGAAAQKLFTGTLGNASAKEAPTDVLQALASLDAREVAGAHLVLLSDLYGDEASFAQGLRALRPAVAALTVFQLLGEDDVALPEVAAVRDAESGEERRIDRLERAAFVSRVVQWRERLRAEAGRAAAGFVELDASQHPAPALRRWLAARR